MFKTLVGKGHPEFSTKRQQDAQEFLLHILNMVEVGYLKNVINCYHCVQVTFIMIWLCIIVSPDESRGYLGFSTVTPPQRFPFGRDNLKIF